MDCPHLIKKRLSKTRIVYFHWGKLTISEILLSYFQGVGDSIVFRQDILLRKKHSNFSVVCVCEGGGGGGVGGGGGGNYKGEGYSLTEPISFCKQINTGATILSFFSVVMNRYGSHLFLTDRYLRT